MVRSSFFLLFSFILIYSSFQVQASQNRISGQLMGIAQHNPGHGKLHQHPFMGEAREGNLTRAQVARFLLDRSLLLEFFESKLKDIDENDKNVFNRSQLYKLDVESITTEEWEGSEVLKNYIKMLNTIESNELVLHHWLLLVGETFGGQHFKGYFKRSEGLGAINFQFDQFDRRISDVQKKLSAWINAQADQFSGYNKENYAKVIGDAYMFHLELMSAALEEKSEVTAPSQGFFSYFYQWPSFLKWFTDKE